MIHIITGDINTGKTTKMLELFKRHPRGDGFVCPKVFENDRFVRYDILHLKSGKKRPFAYPVENLPSNWDEQIRYGKYTFSVQAFFFAEAITHMCLKIIFPLFSWMKSVPSKWICIRAFIQFLKKYYYKIRICISASGKTGSMTCLIV